MKLEELPELHRGDFIEIKREKSLRPAYFIQLAVENGKLSVDYTFHILPTPYLKFDLRRESVDSLEKITVLTKMKDRPADEAALIKEYLSGYPF